MKPLRVETQPQNHCRVGSNKAKAMNIGPTTKMIDVENFRTIIVPTHMDKNGMPPTK
ncbi:hypothetical protein D3C85_1683850 [compost metagenome]